VEGIAMFQMIINKSVILFLILAILSPSYSLAALSIGGEIGANFTNTVNLSATAGTTPIPIPGTSVDVAVLSGIIVQYYFIDKGVLSYDWPNWMNNFSFAVDCTHNRVIFINQPGNFITKGKRTYWSPFRVPTFNGNFFTLSFLFNYRIPLIKSKDFPDGRLFFYAGAGPGITFSSIEANSPGVGSGSASAATFVAESGFSLFALKDFSVDLFFRYRYCNLGYGFDTGDSRPPLELKIENNTFNGGLRIAYHF
jgi:hypothetical protein